MSYSSLTLSVSYSSPKYFGFFEHGSPSQLIDESNEGVELHFSRSIRVHSYTTDVTENHFQKTSRDDTGVRYSHLIPHTVPYRGLSIPYRTVPPCLFFFEYRLVPVRDGTVRYGTDTAYRRSLGGIIQRGISTIFVN